MLKLEIINLTLVRFMSLIINTIKLNLARTYMGAFGYRGELRGLKESTAIKLEKSLTIADCDEIIKRFEDCLNNSRIDDVAVKVWEDDSGSDTRIVNFEQVINKDLLDRLDVENKIKMIELYLGRKVRSWSLMVNRVRYKPENLGSGGGWHRDSPFSHQIKFIWYLSQVTEGCGPFQYIPKSNSAKSRSEYGVGRYRFEEGEITGVIKTVIGNKGSMLICDTAAIHRGAPIRVKCDRYALSLYTSPHKSGVAKIFNLNE